MKAFKHNVVSLNANEPEKEIYNLKKRNLELFKVKEELEKLHEEKVTLNLELLQLNSNLAICDVTHENHLKQVLKEIMFIVSHKIRQPIANLVGLSMLLEQNTNNESDQKKILEYIKESALSLDVFTKELTEFVYQLEQTDHN